MKFFSQDFFMTAISTQMFSARCTIVPVEDDNVTPMPGVTVVLTAPGATQEGNSIVVPLGTTVSINATKEGYQNFTDSIVVNGEVEVKIKLIPVAVTMWEYTITPKPPTANVQMNGSDGTSSNTGTISVPEGSTVTWSVSNTGMNSKTGSRLIPQDSSESSPIVEVVTLTANLSIAGVTPNNARVEWRTGLGDTASGLSISNVPVNTTANLRIYKDGYNEQNVSFPRNGATYITTEQLSAVTLTPKNYTFSVSANPTGSTVKVQKNGGSWQSFTTTATLTDCHVGDVIKYYAEKTGYKTSTQVSYTMGTASYTAPAINLVVNSYSVNITASPSGATVTLVYGNTTKTGTGSVTATVSHGTNISYYASYQGSSSATKTATVSNTYSDSITLVPLNTVEVITSSVSGRVLPKGDYVAILVGGGSAGLGGGDWQYTLVSSSSSTTSYAVGGKGGNGGGSGCVKKITFSANGTDSYNFIVGKGGQRQKAYQVKRETTTSSGLTVNYTRTVDPVDSDLSLNGTDSYIMQGGTEIARAAGGTLVSKTVHSPYGQTLYSSTQYGGTGGNAGGIGDGGQRQAKGAAATDGANGQGGATQGKNSKNSVIKYTRTGSMIFLFKFEGQLGSEGSYDTNTAAFNTNLANPGVAGKGLVSYASSLNTAAKLNSVSEATLLANMSGGGAGSPGGAYSTDSGTGSRCGAPGAGGGGWSNGQNATVDSTVSTPTSANPWYSGSGGDGAILLACLSWT